MQKKQNHLQILAVLLLIPLLCPLFSSCAGGGLFKEGLFNDDSTPKTDALSTLSSYFDTLGLKEGMSEKEVSRWASAFRFEGQPLSEAADESFYDGDYKMGLQAFGSGFGYSKNHYSVPDGSTFSDAVSLYTTAPLEGLTLPCGLSLNKNTLSDALRALGIDPVDGQGAPLWEQGEKEITLLKRDGTALVLAVNTASLSSVENARYHLIFSCGAPCSSSAGKRGYAAKTLTLSFDSEALLTRFSLNLTERYTAADDEENEVTGLALASGGHTLLPYGVLCRDSEESYAYGIGAESFFERAKNEPTLLATLPTLEISGKVHILPPPNCTVKTTALYDEQTGAMTEITPNELPSLAPGVYYLVIGAEFEEDEDNAPRIFEHILRVTFPLEFGQQTG